MFTNKDALDEWLFDMLNRPQGRVTIQEKILPSIDRRNAILLSVEAGSPIAYESVWVRAKWENYRDAMKAYVETHDATKEGIASVDADHVVNRERVLKHHCQAWLMLMPVPFASNRAFGSAVEKSLAAIAPGEEKVLIEPFMLLKAFSATSIRNVGELDEVTRQLSGQIERDETSDSSMEEAVTAY